MKPLSETAPPSVLTQKRVTRSNFSCYPGGMRLAARVVGSEQSASWPDDYGCLAFYCLRNGWPGLLDETGCSRQQMETLDREAARLHRETRSLHRKTRSFDRETRSSHRDICGSYRNGSRSHRDRSSLHRETRSLHRDGSSSHRDRRNLHRDRSSSHCGCIARDRAHSACAGEQSFISRDRSRSTLVHI